MAKPKGHQQREERELNDLVYSFSLFASSKPRYLVECKARLIKETPNSLLLEVHVAKRTTL